MAFVCGFMQYVNCRNAYQNGTQSALMQGDAQFDQLRPDRQERLLAFFKTQKEQAHPPSLWGRVSSKLWGPTLPQLWKTLSASEKGVVIQSFLEKETARKLEKERNAAENQQAQNAVLMQKEEDITPDSLLSKLVDKVRVLLKKIAIWLRVPGADISSRPFGVAHMQGRRAEMEDEHLIAQVPLVLGSKSHTAEVYGIFDGHGGNSAAIFARQQFARCLKDSIEKHCSEGLSDVGLFAAFKETFIQLDADYKADAGSTMSVAVILEGNLWVCNLGDARAILSQKEGTVQLSEDQKCDHPKYVKGVEARGGRILQWGIPRVNGILAIPRALGDHSIRGKTGENCIIHTPKITKTPLSQVKKGSHLIVACDGIWDVQTTEQIGSLVQRHQQASCQSLARKVIDKAYSQGSTDNLSALVVTL